MQECTNAVMHGRARRAQPRKTTRKSILTPAHTLLTVVGLALAILVCMSAGPTVHAQSAAPPIVVRSRGTSPSVRVLRTPEFWGSYAIWGAVSNDARGHIWVGVTSNDDGSASAHLYEFDPASSTFTDRGNVVAELDGRRITPPVASGLLPGVLRGMLLERGEIEEGVLRKDDLPRATRLWFVNHLRGMVEARLPQ